MKNVLSFATIMMASICSAQISIEHNHLPLDGDTLISRNATITGEVDLENSGPDFVWNFGSDILQPLNLNPETPCNPLSELSLIDQAVFNNPFYPEYNSDFGVGFEQTDLVVVSFENSYQIYKNSGDVYAITGVISTINSIPLIAQMNDRDVIYDIPLTYGVSGNSDSELQFEVPTLGFYGLDQTREYECDGWGTLNILDQSFEVVRVKSIVNATDSVYVDFLENGISFERPETITYEWISTSFIVPVLRITTSEGMITAVQIADIVEENRVGENNVSSDVLAFPNPVINELKLTAKESGLYQYKLFASSGRLVETGQFRGSANIAMESLPSGAYFIQLIHEGETSHIRVVKK